MKYNKILIILSIISLLIPTNILLYEQLTTTEGLILKKDLTTTFRKKINISKFIKKLDGQLLDDYIVDTNQVGNKKINIKFKNKYGIKVKKEITINIKDITPPTIIINNPYTITKGSDINLEEEIFCADNYDDIINCQITGEYNLNQIGEYPLNITAIDQSNNITTKDFILKVINKQSSTNKNQQKTSTDFNTIYNKYKNENTNIGLDISKWQGNVDYTKLKNKGVDFVMLKVGGQTKINGEFNLDPKFHDNIKGALENDIKVGVYFYSYATSEKEARQQADWIIEILKDYKVEMPIAFDWENWHQYTKFHLSFHTLNNIASSFINRVEEKGYKGILYSSKNYLENIWYQDEYTTWLAYYNDNFNNYQSYYMWQMCNDGKIDGINGYVDINIMYNQKNT